MHTTAVRLRSLLAAVLLALVAFVPGRSVAVVEAAIILNALNGDVLYQANADAGTSPASLAKMMTLYLTFEALEQGRLKLGQALPVSRRAAAQPASKLGLIAGQTLQVEDAIRGLVTKSANDAAMVLSEALGGSEEEFAKKMTAKAKGLGMHNTNFRNSSGLYHSQQYTTARDMAKLGVALQRDYPRQYPYFSIDSFTYKGTTYTNHNGLLGRYAGADGLKTGYIDASGYNLAASVARGNTRLVGVVLGAKTIAARDQRMTGLLDASFSRLATLEFPNQIRRPAATTLAATRPATNAPPTAPPAKPATPTVATPNPGAQQASTRRTDGWAVQVGAYRDFFAATERLAQVTRVAGGSARAAAAMVLPPEAVGGMHRVRIAQLSQVEAQGVCRLLESRGIPPCLVISPQSHAADMARVDVKPPAGVGGTAVADASTDPKGVSTQFNEILRMLRPKADPPRP